MPTTCEIVFENPLRVFYAGQLLSGTHMRITEYCNHDNSTTSSGHYISYSGSEDYLNEKTEFIGSSSGELTLPPGTHTYNFQVMLPAGLPTSVQNDIGHIAYGANVVLDIPMSTNKEFKEHFTVIKPINLNEDPLFRQSVSAIDERVFCPPGFLCCRSAGSGPLQIEASAPVNGYCPGQTINVTIKITNDSNEEVGSLNVELIKQTTFYGNALHNGIYENKQKIVDDIMTGEEIRECPIGQTHSNCVNLIIPSIPPTDSTTCNVVHVKYYIRVRGLLISGCNATVLNLPITIGTYPLIDDRPNDNSIQLANVISTQPTAPILPNEESFKSIPKMAIGLNVPSAPFEPFPCENPPTYEEVITSAGRNNNDFKPKYPTFRRPTSYSFH